MATHTIQMYGWQQPRKDGSSKSSLTTNWWQGWNGTGFSIHPWTNDACVEVGSRSAWPISLEGEKKADFKGDTEEENSTRLGA